MSAALSLAGWVTAGLVAVRTVSVRRCFGDHREAVARACHELRGPLTAARLGLVVAPGARSLPPARVRAIDAELGRAALALDDLSRPRASARARARERIEVGELLADSVEAWRASAEAAGGSLELRGSSTGGAVWGDRARLAQATGNLIANAIEHGGGAVRVAAVVRSGDGVVRISVTDGGPGLPAPVDELRRLRPRRGRGDRGRGLAIAGLVAEAHGGRLAAAPAARGARLLLVLPLAGRSAPPLRAG